MTKSIYILNQDTNQVSLTTACPTIKQERLCTRWREASSVFDILLHTTLKKTSCLAVVSKYSDRQSLLKVNIESYNFGLYSKVNFQEINVLIFFY